MLLSYSVHQTILCIFATVSFAGNTLLMTLILQQQSRVLGNYRWLLLIFAIGDIIISLFHAYSVPYGCAVFTWTGVNKPPTIGFILNTIYCLLFYEPFILLSFHFIYRYFMLENPKLISNNMAACALLALALNLIFSFIVAWSSLIIDTNSGENFFGEVLFELYRINMTSQPMPNIIPLNFVHMEERGGGINWITMKAIALSSAVSLTTLAVNVFCTVQIVRILKSMATNMSNKTRKLQIQLFRALIVQFLVPFILCFVPFSTSVALPLTGIRFGEMGNIIGNLASIFPATDAFLVLIMVGRFRSILVSWISSCAKKNLPQSLALNAEATQTN